MRFDDAAYCEGYANGRMLPWLETKREQSRLPLYFAFGAANDLRTGQGTVGRSTIRQGMSSSSLRW